MRIWKLLMIATALAVPCATAQATDVAPDVPSEVDTTNAGIYFRGDAAWSFLEWSGGSDDNSFVAGGGIGYQFNDMLRSDVTLDMSGGYKVAPGAEISTTTILGNLYLDIPTETMFTPYVGVGVGYGWVDSNPDGLAVGFSTGVAVGITPNLDVDAGYRLRDIMNEGPDVIEHQATMGLRFKF
jgi:opacity protein-like surface antigen